MPSVLKPMQMPPRTVQHYPGHEKDNRVCSGLEELGGGGMSHKISQRLAKEQNCGVAGGGGGEEITWKFKTNPFSGPRSQLTGGQVSSNSSFLSEGEQLV